MRRPILAALLLAGTLLMGVPVGLAQARIEMDDLDVFNEKGQRLTRVATGQPARFVANLTNTGNESFNGTLSVVFLIESDDQVYERNQTVTVNESIAPGGSLPVRFDWIAQRVGKHTMQAYVTENRDDIFTLRFEVAQSEVLREPLTRMALSYSWVYASFFVALVLFFAVTRHRRTR